MKKNWNRKRFIALFMAIAMVFVSGIVVTYSSFHASNTDEYQGEDTVETQDIPVAEDEPSTEDVAVDVSEETQPQEAPAEEAAPAEETAAAPAEEAAPQQEAAPAAETTVLHYDANADDVTGEIPEEVTAASGSEIDVDDGVTFAREGFVFDHWNTEPDDSGTSYQKEDKLPLTAEVTLYAQWLTPEEAAAKAQAQEQEQPEQTPEEEAAAPEEEAETPEEEAVTEEPEEKPEEEAAEEEEPEEEETEDENVEEKDEEIPMPAADFSGITNKGVAVSASAGEGVFPEGTTMVVKDVSEKKVRAKVEKVLDDDEEVVDLSPVDIAFYDKDGNEIEPAGSVNVNISLPNILSAENYGLIHISDNGAVSEVRGADVSGSEAEFTASDFSYFVPYSSSYDYLGSHESEHDLDRNQTYTVMSAPTITTTDYYGNQTKNYLGGTWRMESGSDIVSITSDSRTTWKTNTTDAPTVRISTGNKNGDAVLSYTYTHERNTYTSKFILHVVSRTIEFDLNGGSGTKPDDIDVEIGDSGKATVQLPAADGLARDGYQMVGWAKNSNACTSGTGHGFSDTIYFPGSTYTTSTADQRNMTFYAVWAPTSGVYGNLGFYIRNDGTIQQEPARYDSSHYTTVMYMDHSCGQDICAFINPAQTVWDLESVDRNITPYAKSLLEQYNEQQGKKFWDPDNGEYVVWYVIKNQSNGSVGDWHVDGVVRTKEMFNIDYHKNCDISSGGAVPVSKQYPKGSTQTIQGNTGNITRDGYTFLGWNTSADGTGTSYYGGEEITLDSDVDLYAMWGANSDTMYTVRYFDSETNEEITTATKVKRDVTGKTITADESDKTLAGYVFDEENEGNVLSAKIAGNGTTELKLYFKQARTVKVILSAEDKKYDGQAVTGADITVKVDGEEVEASFQNGTITFTYKNKEYQIENFAVSITKTDGSQTDAKDAGSYAVTGTPGSQLSVKGSKAFSVEVLNGSFTINARTVSLTSKSGEWDYDGRTHSAQEIEAEGDGWLSGDEPEFVFDPSTVLRAPGGPIDNVFNPKDCTWNELAAGMPNYSISHEFGKLTVKAPDAQYGITLSAAPVSVEYDGQTHSVRSENIELSLGGASQIENDVPLIRKLFDFVAGNNDITFTKGGETYTMSGVSVVGDGGADAGEYDITVNTENITIKDEDGNVVTNLFVVTPVSSKITITQRVVKITSASLSKKYDGDPLENGEADVTLEGSFVSGEEPSYTFTGSQTVVGFSNNTFSYAFKEGVKESNYQITPAYGQLTVTDPDAKYTATVTAKSGEHVYNNQTYTVSGFEGEQEDGRIRVTASNNKTYYVTGLSASAEQKIAGSSNVNIVGTPSVFDEKNNDVSSVINIVPQAGTLTVTKRPISFTSASLSKTYDGTALTNPDNNLETSTEDEKIKIESNGSVGGRGFAEGESATFTFTGTQTVAGQSANAFTPDWSETTAANYEVTKTEGTLFVDKREVPYSVTVNGMSGTETYTTRQQFVDGFDTYTYEGDTHKIAEADENSRVMTITVEGVEFTIQNVYAEAAGTDAGTYTQEIEGADEYKVFDANNQDVTDQFTIRFVPGTLTIKPVPVTITSRDLSKPYDGTALTDDGSAYEFSCSMPAIRTHGPILTFTGSQTLVGSSENSFTCAFHNDKVTNYNVNAVFGTLTVTGALTGEDMAKVVTKSHEAKTYGVDDTVTFEISVTNIYADARTITLTEKEGVTLAQNVFENVAGGETVTTTAAYVLTDADVTNADGFKNTVTASFSEGDTPGGTFTGEDTVTPEQLNGEAVYTVSYINEETNEEIKTAASRNTSVGETVNVADEDKTITGYDFNANHEKNVLSAQVKKNNGTELKLYFMPKHTVTFVFGGTGKMYDGTPVTDAGLSEVKVDGVPVEYSLSGSTITYTLNGKSYEITGFAVSVEGADADGTIKNAGTYKVTLGGSTDDLKISADGTELTAKEFALQEKTIVITKRDVTITSASASRQYNGKPLTAQSVEYGGSGWVSGEEPSSGDITVTGSQKAPGSSENTFKHNKSGTTWDEAFPNYAVQCIYGTLTVTNREASYAITVRAEDQSTKSDGRTPLTYNGQRQEAAKGDFVIEGAGVSAHELTLIERLGDRFTNTSTTYFTIEDEEYSITGISVEGGGTDAGSYDILVEGNETIRDSSGNDVTEQFNVNKIGAKLTIAKADVTLRSADLSKSYDGTPLTNGSAALATESGWASGEGATYEFTASQTAVGTKPNTFNITLNENTKEDNYNIPAAGQREGSLTVTSSDAAFTITLTPDLGPKGGIYTYDGDPHSVSGFKEESGGLITVTASNGETYTIYGYTCGATGTAAGTYPVQTSGNLVITDMEGNDVTSEFSVIVGEASLVINPRPITFTSASLKREYNGKRLTNPGDELIFDTVAEGTELVEAGSIGGEGFAKNETTGFEFTGWRKLVGQDYNTFAPTWTEDVSKNYDVTIKPGVLYVINRSVKYDITLQANSGEGIYDGTEQFVEGFVSYTIDRGKETEQTIEFSQAFSAAGSESGDETGSETGAETGSETGDETDGGFSALPDDLPIVVEDVPYTIRNVTARAAATNANTGIPGQTDAPAETVITVAEGKSIQVLDEDGADVSDQFSVIALPGTLSVTPRELTLKSEDVSRVYDATELVNGELEEHAVTVTEGQLVMERMPFITFTGGQTLIGESVNSFDWSFTDPDSGEKIDEDFNYIITKDEGTLSVTALKDEKTTEEDSKDEVDDEDVIRKNHETGTYKVDDKITFTVTVKNIFADKRTITLTEREGVELKKSVFEDVEPGAEVETTATRIVTTEDITSNENFVNTVNAKFSDGESDRYNADPDGYDAEDPVGKDCFDHDAVYRIVYHDVEKLGNNDIIRTTEEIGCNVGDTVSVTEDQLKLEGYDYDSSNTKNVESVTVEKNSGTTLDVYFTPGHTVKVVFGGTGKMYDGTPVSASVTKVLVGTTEVPFTVDGNTLTYTMGTRTYTVTGAAMAITKDGVSVDEIKDAGAYTATISGTTDQMSITEGSRTLGAYDFEVVPAAINIQKRDVTITSATDTWEYDGEPHSNTQLTYSGSGWVEGETPDDGDIKVTGVQKAPGTSKNTFVPKSLTDKSWTEVYPNYAITTVEGDLTVTGRETKYEVNITANDINAGAYDGRKHEASKDGFIISGSLSAAEEASLLEKVGDVITQTKTTYFRVGANVYSITGLSAVGSGTDAGTYPIRIDGKETIKDMDGNDVTDQFTANKTSGTLTIGKADVSITSASPTKVYDGDALTNGDNELVQTGWVDGEGIVNLTFTGSQTVPGFSANSFTYDLKQNTKADNYNITKTEGTLTVTSSEASFEVTVTPKTNTQIIKYDGQEHEVHGFVGQEKDGRIPVEAGNGKTYYISGISASASGTDAGKYKVNVTGTVKVEDAEKNDVTSEFTVKTAEVFLEISKRRLELTSASLSKTYDGKPLVNPDAHLQTEGAEGITIEEQGVTGGDGFAPNELMTVSMTFTGSQRKAGHSDNTFTLNWNGVNPDNYDYDDAQDRHFGTLTVKNRGEEDLYPVTLTGETSDPVTYDGETHSVPGLSGEETNGDGIPKNLKDIPYVKIEAGGETYYVTGITAEASGRDAGSYQTEFNGSARIYDSDGEDVTDQFATPTLVPSTLTIEKKNVTLTSADLEKTYDGKALTNGDTALSENSGWVGSEGVICTFTGSQTVVGDSPNAFSYAFKDNTKETNYIITKSEGTLSVKNRDAADLLKLSVIAKSGSAVYDGKEHTVSGFEDMTESGIRAESGGEFFYITGITSEASSTNATGPNGVQTSFSGTPVVKDALGNDVSAQFDVVKQAGSLVIERRDLILRSADLNKPYDGKALENGSEPLAEESGWVKGEGASYRFTARQTRVGFTPNTFEVRPKENTNLDNYNVPAEGQREGTLTVTSRDAAFAVTLNAAGDTVTYDDEDHSVSGFAGYTYNGTDYEIKKSKEGEENGSFEIEIDGVTYTISGVSSAASGTDANAAQTDGKGVPTTITGTPVVTDEEGQVVTDQFAITPAAGRLLIRERKVTLSSETLTKVYDGYPLENGNGKVTVGGDGLLETEQLSFTFTGKQTLIGKSENSFTYSFTTRVNEQTVTEGEEEDQSAAGTKTTLGNPDNYDIKTKFGDLIVTASGKDEDGKDVNVDPSRVTTKTHEDNEAGFAKIGDTIDFTLTATNIYEDARTITFIEPETVKVDQAVFENVPGGETVSTTAHYTITEEDALNGGYTNTVTTRISGAGDVGGDFPASDTVIVEKPAPSIAISKTSDAKGTLRLGDKVTYTVTVINNGNVAVRSIKAEDALTGENWNIDSLAAGASETLKTEYTVTEKDVAAGRIVNTATAKGTGGGDTAVEAEGQTEDAVNRDFNLTIHYSDTDGNKLAGDYTDSVQYGASFHVLSPAVSGYTAQWSYVASPEGGMPAKDVEVTVNYLKNPEAVAPVETDDDKKDDGKKDESGSGSSESTRGGRSEAAAPAGGKSQNNAPSGGSSNRTESGVAQDNTSGASAGVRPNGSTSVTVASTQRASNEEVEQAGYNPGGAVVSISDDGEAELVSASDTATPLADLGLEDAGHLCNVMYLVLVFVLMIEGIVYANRMKLHQARIFELKEKKKSRS